EATATLLADLGSAFTIWHDVATGYGNETWARDASAPVTDPAKLDHVVLGPTGLLVVQSEDWGAPARPKGRDLTSAGLAKGAHPVRDLARRAKVARKWRVRLSALIVVLDDDALDVDFAQLGRPGSLPRFALRRRELIARVSGVVRGVQRVPPGAIFGVRTALQNSVRFVCPPGRLSPSISPGQSQPGRRGSASAEAPRRLESTRDPHPLVSGIHLWRSSPLPRGFRPEKWIPAGPYSLPGRSPLTARWVVRCLPTPHCAFWRSPETETADRLRRRPACRGLDRHGLPGPAWSAIRTPKYSGARAAISTHTGIRSQRKR